MATRSPKPSVAISSSIMRFIVVSLEEGGRSVGGRKRLRFLQDQRRAGGGPGIERRAVRRLLTRGEHRGAAALDIGPARGRGDDDHFGRTDGALQTSACFQLSHALP